MYYLGDRHRAHRKLFNPAFSIAHMRDIGMCQRICIKDNPFDQTVIFISSNFLWSWLQGDYPDISLFNYSLNRFY